MQTLPNIFIKIFIQFMGTINKTNIRVKQIVKLNIVHHQPAPVSSLLVCWGCVLYQLCRVCLFWTLSLYTPVKQRTAWTSLPASTACHRNCGAALFRRAAVPHCNKVTDVPTDCHREIYCDVVKWQLKADSARQVLQKIDHVYNGHDSKMLWANLVSNSIIKIM